MRLRRDYFLFDQFCRTSLDEIRIENLKVGSGSVDLAIHRRARYATVEIDRREGDLEVLTEA